MRAWFERLIDGELPWGNLLCGAVAVGAVAAAAATAIFTPVVR